MVSIVAYIRRFDVCSAEGVLLRVFNVILCGIYWGCTFERSMEVLSPQSRQAHMAADWFHKLGYTLPYGTNVADFILDLASGAILTDERCAAGLASYRHPAMIPACCSRL